MSSVTKWKIATYIFAISTAVAVWRGRSGEEGLTATAAAAGRTDSTMERRVAALGRLRVPAHALGLDESQLLADLQAARSPEQVEILCSRLALVGTDRSLDVLESLVADPRPGVTYQAMLAMGGIGSDEATSRLIELLESSSRTTRYWAVEALAKTGQERAARRLVELAQHAEDPLRTSAITALGKVGGAEVLALLRDLAKERDVSVLSAVAQAAGTMSTKESLQLLETLARSSSPAVRQAALGALPTVSGPEQEAWLMEIATTGDPQTASAAVLALGRARVADAIPLLEETVFSGPTNVRYQAVMALRAIGGKEATASLARILAKGAPNVGYDVAQSLLDVGGDAGRDAVLDALRDPSKRQTLMNLLTDLRGEDADAVRLDILRNGRPWERNALLNQMVANHDDAIVDVAKELVATGSNDSAQSALGLLARSNTPAARAALVEVAKSGGTRSADAIRQLGSSAVGGEEDVQEILIEAFYSDDERRRAAAAQALAASGSQAGQDALLAGIGSGDLKLVQASLQAAYQLPMQPQVIEGLAAAARSSDNAGVRSQIMSHLIQIGAPEAVDLVEESLSEGGSSVGYQIGTLMQNGVSGAERLLSQASASADAQVRAGVARGLGGRSDADSMALLDRLIDDEDSSVSAAAVQALSQTGTARATERLIEVARTGADDARQAALTALTSHGDPRAREVLVEAIRAGGRHAMFAMGNAYQAEGPVVEAMLSLAKDGSADAELRRMAAQNLLSSGVPQAEEHRQLLEGLGAANRYEGATYGGDPDQYYDIHRE